MIQVDSLYIYVCVCVCVFAHMHKYINVFALNRWNKKTELS